MSTLRSRAGLSLAMLLPLLSCGGPRVLPPEPKVNPSPTERYEITLIVQDPPAAYRIGDAWTQMDIPNQECVPLADRIAGYKPSTSVRQPFKLEMTYKNVYVGYIYADYFLAEDYYGKGVCQWKVTTVRAGIHMENIEQSVWLDEAELNGERLNYCRRPDTDPYSPITCLSPSYHEPSDKDREMNYFVIVKSRRA